MSNVATHDIQSIVFSGHGRLRQALAVGFAVEDRAVARASLAALAKHDLSFGMLRGARKHSVQLMVSAAGVAALDGTTARTSGLNTSYCEGIVTPQRSRALGDAGRNDPSSWAWSDAAVHVLLLLYAPTQADLDEQEETVTKRLTGWRRVFDLPICLPRDNREPFGFRDGISAVRIDLGDGSPAMPGIDVIPPGEIVLGYRAANGTEATSPPLGTNGAYVVVRQLEQDVEGFWKFWRSQAKNDEEAVWLAAKAVGRWPNGMPLHEGPPGAEPASKEEVVFRSLNFGADRAGQGCPFGSHIRRANPRDTLVEDPRVSREVVSHHRLMRRGRMYGAPAPRAWYPKLVDRPELDDDVSKPTSGRGLLFMCLCSDIARQFEFVQQTWLNNPKFADLYDEVDPTAAGEGMPQDSRRFSIPGCPVRRRVHGVQRWVTVKGAGYYLLPGREALLTWLNAKP